MKKTLLFLIMTTALVWSNGQTYHVGDLYTAPDSSKGIVFYVLSDGGAWVMALNDLEIPDDAFRWGVSQDIPTIPNLGFEPSFSYLYSPLLALADTAGYNNTMGIVTYSQNTMTAAHAIVNHYPNGWYLPAVGQLCMIYAQLPLIETALIDAGGSPMKCGLWDTYWSSTEMDAYTAWAVNFSLPMPETENNFIFSHSGQLNPEDKMGWRYVRAVRSIPSPCNIYDTTLTYLWNTGSTESHIQDVPLENSSYSVTVTNAYGCTNTASGSVIVLDNEPQTLYDTICQGAIYNNYGFMLSAEETAVAGEIVRTRTVTTANCESEITLFLFVAPSDTVYLDKLAYLSYVWNGITYNESGTYIQYLNNFAGCDSVVILQLTITEEPPFENDSDNLVIYLPNAITPSRSDGLNDCFYLPEYYHPLINDFEISIFNRWGNLIYYSTDENFKWYGEFEGKTFYDVVYNYLIRYRDSVGKPYILKGFITVL